MSSIAVNASVMWPNAPLTRSLVMSALKSIPEIQLSAAPALNGAGLQLLWSSYDEINHEITHRSRDTVLSSSYTIRKALIRKHFLSRCVHSYVTKHVESPLKTATPRTWDLEISWADELDELWADELYDLASAMETDNTQWWILKPGMADRGMGIRLFNSQSALQRIFEEFDGDDSDDNGENAHDESAGTDVVTSQLRHFVIQEYLSRPILIDPAQANTTASPKVVQGHKFHLRVYCVSSGALTLYLYPKVLALFSSVPYRTPLHQANGSMDLKPHLTNSSLQTHLGDQGVRLLEELIGCDILSDPAEEPRRAFSTAHVENILDQASMILAETFKAAIASPVHFQPLPNAFELFGVDFLVTHASSGPALNVQLLEINAEPAIELTGSRLTWILEDLFEAIAKVCVTPFFADKTSSAAMTSAWPLQETRFGLRKCLEAEVRPQKPTWSG